MKPKQNIKLMSMSIDFPNPKHRMTNASQRLLLLQIIFHVEADENASWITEEILLTYQVYIPMFHSEGTDSGLHA